MKRYFEIEGLQKEAPARLKETPQRGSLIRYNGSLYRVAEIEYDFSCGEVYITLKKCKM
jgi:hypothetical protein